MALNSVCYWGTRGSGSVVSQGKKKRRGTRHGLELECAGLVVRLLLFADRDRLHDRARCVTQYHDGRAR
jgi:hypothetical protein